MIKKKIESLSETKKYLKKEKIKTVSSNLSSLSRTFLASLIIIITFFVSPVFVEFAKNSSLTSIDFENNSKNSLKKLLEKKDIESDNVINQSFLFEDILRFDEKPSDSVRLSAATIEELFKSTNYSLEDVRKTKLVKPITLTLLPNEIKKIENTKKRKDLLFKLFYH